jgi:hypothetical protein
MRELLHVSGRVGKRKSGRRHRELQIWNRNWPLRKKIEDITNRNEIISSTSSLGMYRIMKVTFEIDPPLPGMIEYGAFQSKV